MEKKKALNIVMKMCSRKEYCEADIRKKLQSWEINEESINWVLKELRKHDFINEKRYTTHFIHDKIWLNKWGKIKVQYFLNAKKIPSPIIHEFLDVIDEEKYKSMIRDVIGKKMKNIKAKSKLEKKSKLFRFGASRGYEQDILYSVLNEMLQ